MAGETGKMAEIANKLSKELFEWFRWDRVPIMDQNFPCSKQAKHAPAKTAAHTHPVDVVFSYMDPYLGKRVFLNTDLKSYAKASIKSGEIRSALKSLAQTIDCARSSEDWNSRYNLKNENCEIRGLLFVYNHDGDYDKAFLELFKPKQYKTATEEAEAVEKSANLASLPLESDMFLHIAEPRLISLMTTIRADVNRLIAEGTFPRKNYRFFYPDLKLHKTHGDEYARPATIEMISGPFMIVEHDKVSPSDEITAPYSDGTVIFYNREGKSAEEFLYFIDTLSNLQLLKGTHPIRIRVVHDSPSKDLRSHFQRAIEMYIAEWGFDMSKRDRLESIELEIVEIVRTRFSSVELGWDRK